MLFLKVLNDTIEYWIRSSELPQNINMHGANTAVKLVFLSERGTIVCSWSSSKFKLSRGLSYRRHWIFASFSESLFRLCLSQ